MWSNESKDDVTDDEDLAKAADLATEELTDDDELDDAMLDEALLENPLEKFRKGYLWVSNLTAQIWCEQQMEYGFTRPQEIKEPEHVFRGSELHLSRELQTEDYIDVQVESDEDIFAIKALNLYLHLKNVKSLKLCREVPVFGWIGNLFLLGKIDELRHVDKDNSIELSEFKTRTKSFLPSAAQQKTHNLQVMIYKYLLTNVQSIDINELCKTLKLNPSKRFGPDVIKHCPTKVENLNDLFHKLKQLEEIHVSNLVIDYSCQDKDEVFASIPVKYEEVWLLETVSKCEQYWMGQRFAQGVDIEDAWKCSMCSFADNCEWRIAKANELTNRKS